MITVDEETKKKLGQLIDSDGKVIISDDMPEDLKDCLKYLNDNNINLLSPNPDAYIEDYEPDPFAPDFQDSEDDEEILNEDEEDSEDEEDYDDEEETEDLVDENAINDLESLF